MYNNIIQSAINKITQHKAQLQQKIMNKTGTLKNKSSIQKSKPISMLSDKLFESIGTVDVSQINKASKTASNFHETNRMNASGMFMGNSAVSLNKAKETNQRDFEIVINQQDPLARLINKAKQITSQNHHKIQKAKKQLRQQRQKYGTFLTGTGLYEAEQGPPIQFESNNDVDPNDLLKQLIHREKNDDLAQLRRMIKETNRNLNGYEKQMYYSSQGVMEAADQFNKQLDTGLRYKMNKIKVPQGEDSKNSSRKAFSVNRIKDPKYC